MEATPTPDTVEPTVPEPAPLAPRPTGRRDLPPGAPLTADAEAAMAQVQAAMDAEQAQGFVGDNPDPTPNLHYTVEGVVAGKPTPETDAEQAAKVGRRF